MTKRDVHDGRVAARGLKAKEHFGKKGDGGDTLVEVLLALVVLSLASVALIIAFGTSISASADHRDIANYNTVLASAEADVRTQIQINPTAIFGTCTPWTTNANYPTSAQLDTNLPSTDTASIVSVQYWNGTAWSSSCTGLSDPSQLITIQIADRSSKQPPQDIQIVVNDPGKAASPQGAASVAAQLIFVTEPSGATYNTPFATQPVVEVESSTGQLVNSNLSYITMSIRSGPSGGILSSCSGTESSGYVYFSGCTLNETGTYQLEATLNAPVAAQDIYGYSDAFAVTATQLDTPFISNVVPSTTTAGALNVTFAPSSTGSTIDPAGQLFTVKACTDSAMSIGCIEQAGFSSGTDLDSLYPGTAYYVQVTATSSTNYLPATSPPTGPTTATIQLLPPGTPTLGYGSTAGSINVIFAPSPNAATPQTYTVSVCTSATSGCVVNSNFTSGSDFAGLAFTAGHAGGTYYVEVVANASPGYLISGDSAQVTQADTSQVAAPGRPTVSSSTTTPGVINATFTASTGVAPGGYTAEACTSGVCTNPITANPAGTQFTGLTAGASYAVVVTALPPNSAYVSNTSTLSNPVVATLQLNVPGTPTLGFGTAPGSLSVTVSSSNAPTGQLYTVVYCTNAGMTTGCVTNANFTSGSNLSGLAYVAGSPGATYYVEVSANASTGYLASGLSTQASHADTSILAVTGAPSATSSTTTAGALTVTFVASSGQAPSSYTVTACTNTLMTTGCLSTTGVASGGQATGLVPGTKYFLSVTAISTNAAFASSSPSATSSTSVMATVQLTIPTNVSVVPSTNTAGALGVTFTAPSNAPGGQNYSVTICSNGAMTANCVTQSNYVSGAQITGFGAGTNYFATITALASAGYLSSTSAVSSAGAATVQLTAPTVVTAASSTTTAGALNVTFIASSNGAAGQTYAVTTCTNAGMSSGCSTKTGVASGGGAITGLTPGTNYYVTVSASASTGYLASLASTPVVGPNLATVQLTPPTGVTVTPSTGSPGSLTVAFTPPSNATGAQSYTAKACTDSVMTLGCVTVTNFSSGGSISTLAPGTKYFVTVAAPASTGYLASISAVTVTSVQATVQLTAPGTPTLGYGSVAGSLSVAFTGSANAAGSQIYTVEACTNAGMSTGCVTNANFTSGSNLTLLADTPGTAGATYYVQVSANASAGYLASGPSTQASHADTSQLAVPGTPSATSSTTTAGALNVTFAASAGQVPNSYTVLACTNAGMTTNCIGPTAIASGGGQLGGLVGGSSYFLSVNAVSTNAAFVSNTSTTSGSSYLATAQLNVITFTTVTPSTTSTGVIAVVFAGPSNAPVGQTYTVLACTNSNMTSPCVGPTAIASGGGNVSGLTPGAQYYIQITATASSGYLAELSSISGPTVATTQLTTPAVSSVTSSTTAAGALVVSVTAPTNAPVGQTYAVTACNNAGMSTGCVTQTGILSAGQITTLVQGTKYYVYAIASASPGYLVSTKSATTTTSVMATVQLTTPTISTVTASGNTALVVNFAVATNGPGNQTYSAEACTTIAMTGASCVTNANIATGGQITGLANHGNYYVAVTVATVTPGYLPATFETTTTTRS
jgi:type II secretory pathway pseudopilin PulG